jgi:hypothetical protein
MGLIRRSTRHCVLKREVFFLGATDLVLLAEVADADGDE